MDASRAVRRPLLALLGSVAALLAGLAAQEVRDNTAQLVAVVTEEVSSGAPQLLLSERGPLGGATEDVCGAGIGRAKFATSASQKPARSSAARLNGFAARAVANSRPVRSSSSLGCGMGARQASFHNPYVPARLSLATTGSVS